MKLGSLSLSNNLLLAPLQNVTTSPFRRFCRYFQDIGLVYVPMIYTKRIIKNPKFLEQELIKIEEEQPISIQLVGSDPNTFKGALEHLESYKYASINLNAGCSSVRSLKTKHGGYLIKDLELLNTIINLVVKYSSRPVSLKTRIGYDGIVNINEFSKMINDSGLDFIIIHARTAMDRFKPIKLNLDALKEIKSRLNIPVIGNGDINTPMDAENMLKHTNVDALMIGRESMGNPEIFNNIHEYLSNGKIIYQNNHVKLMKKRLEIYEKIMNEFIQDISLTRDIKEYKFKELKRNAIWLTRNIQFSNKYRYNLCLARNLRDLRKILDIIYSES